MEILDPQLKILAQASYENAVMLTLNLMVPLLEKPYYLERIGSVLSISTTVFIDTVIPD